MTDTPMNENKEKIFQPDEKTTGAPHPEMNGKKDKNKEPLFTADLGQKFYRSWFERLESFLQNELLIEDDCRILIAVSGGVDSVTLMDSLAQTALRKNFEIHIAHFNHQLRGRDSDDDYFFVQSLAKRYGFRFHGGHGHVKSHSEKYGISIEMAARVLRYKFLEKTAVKAECNIIATAHNSDDNVETFLLNLLRGTGLTGLSGIPARRSITRSIFVIRPLLTFSKKEIRDYAAKRMLDWHEDATNTDNKFLRNKIRNELIPYLRDNYSEAVISNLSRASAHITGADNLIDKFVQDALEKVLLEKSNTRFSVRIQLLEGYDPFVKGEIIIELLKKYFSLYGVNYEQIDRIISLSKSSNGSIYRLSENHEVLKDRNNLIFYARRPSEIINKTIIREGRHDFESFTLRFEQVSRKDFRPGANPDIEYFDSDFMPQVLCVRNWNAGDIFRPLGMGGSMKVSDFLINSKTDMLQKRNQFVLTDRSKIIWLMGKRMSEDYKVTDATENILRVEYSPKAPTKF